MEVKSNVVSKKCSFWATPKMDLFLSRVSNQVSAYFFCKLDLFSKDRDAFQVSQEHIKGCAFSQYSLMGKSLKKVLTYQRILVLVTPALQAQTMVFTSPANVNKASPSFAQSHKSFDSLKREDALFDSKRKLDNPSMDSFSKYLYAEGISEDSVSLILDSRR